MAGAVMMTPSATCACESAPSKPPRLFLSHGSSMVSLANLQPCCRLHPRRACMTAFDLAAQLPCVQRAQQQHRWVRH